MKENQIKSIIHKKFRNYNKSEDIKEATRNILKRNFDTEKLNEKWVSDITYIWTRKDGWCYLSSIMDLYSRRIISHKVGKFMDIKLVMDTLKMAIYKRGDTTNLIIHTDRRSQYMSKEYCKFCAKKGISISYSRTSLKKYTFLDLVKDNEFRTKFHRKITKKKCQKNTRLFEINVLK